MRGFSLSLSLYIYIYKRIILFRKHVLISTRRTQQVERNSILHPVKYNITDMFRCENNI